MFHAFKQKHSAEKLRLHVPARAAGTFFFGDVFIKTLFIMFVCFISELWYTAANVHSRVFVALKENGVDLQS